jgi:hypothetical protein
MKGLVAVIVLAALTGCGANPLLRASNQAVNLGQGLPADMVNRHVAGIVAFDEQWTDNYGRLARGALYSQGVEKGKPEYGYRAARINLSQTSSGLWVTKGSLMFSTGAYVPDQLPQLHRDDVVEIRQTGTWMTMEDFATRGEGNIVVRILCRKADPNYEQCLNQAPKVGEFRGVGETHTPYPASVRDYGFTFTPMFDAEGRALRPYPPVAATATR